jgi:hypothetical protein
MAAGQSWVGAPRGFQPPRAGLRQRSRVWAFIAPARAAGGSLGLSEGRWSRATPQGWRLQNRFAPR